MSEAVALRTTASDEELVERILEGETAQFELIMRRYNPRLYRVARSILRDDAEAEDVMQDAYVRAYQHLAQFEGRAKFGTWLTRIAVHEALARLRQRGRFQEPELREGEDEMESIVEQLPSKTISPEHHAHSAELRVLLESAIEKLPRDYRTAIMLRDVEELSTAEAAECLEITEENLKVRLHRARAMVRKNLATQVGTATREAFQFFAPRCNRVVANVMARIQ